MTIDFDGLANELWLTHGRLRDECELPVETKNCMKFMRRFREETSSLLQQVAEQSREELRTEMKADWIAMGLP